ncbi:MULTISPECIES: glycogen/starch/alpha-glucan phosphorylase [unclassified Collinsella]|uniref:glycogen/starch/alpha-glucan phosphorylase n=1 Tax=unclassified Collinsella TaxID=2637548 RepID=UPI000E4AC9C4|nr:MULTISPECIES: glycogen/starch/alpha-glucan phosphorylase [unclassified Collinsella]RHJ39385.1 glycogen/starch/alpha-glucan phosphorylase [Collinsella sp. AM10-48]RHJ39695.1 glycogen/starch/alpha-glucan phosphorylase [Collinsella sp. AM10-32]RHJ44383.1 glycogen/starch/alpha-glucan phosphorylase [Collinsella sp. AM10-27]RHJ45071.1 glycogen/starch/alpha-glucan phosphorylase [Collinsella sp. AM10-26]RHJ53534.1 glycogen/starch/alpha-glucan phosphorylase [Collinsella sp. AM10-11]
MNKIFDNKQEFTELYRDAVMSISGKSVEAASDLDRFNALAKLVAEKARTVATKSDARATAEGKKRVYYFSIEFLIGRLLDNYLLNFGVRDMVAEALDDMGFDLSVIENQEPDPALGNGGLGRLAACFLDSMAAEGIAGYGNGMRYRYGLFKQEIVNGSQVETTDEWLTHGYPWEVRRQDKAVTIKFGGRVEGFEEDGRTFYRTVDTQDILAVPYDIPVVGYAGETVNKLRVWAAEPVEEHFDLEAFNRGDYALADAERAEAEAISAILYPNDAGEHGRLLRLKQEYLFVSAGIYSLLDTFEKEHGANWELLPQFVAIHTNDTHPAMCGPELMRILIDEKKLEWDDAWNIVTQVVSYTNHTILPEALEKWPIGTFSKLLPRVYQIIDEISRRWHESFDTTQEGWQERLRQTAILWDGEIRMANLSVICSHSVNGVAKIHSDIIKNIVLKDFYALTPEKFNNKTNGISHRRFFAEANPTYAKLVTDAIGDGWLKDAFELEKLKEFKDDTEFLKAVGASKRANKERLAAYVKAETGLVIDPNTVFDVQVKRFHAYKRQLMNIMKVMDIYNRRIANPNFHVTPTTFIFSGKAASSYTFAKETIRLINSVADVINNDARVNEVMKVCFIPNFRVSNAQLIYPAAEISEQISTAGKEASGTSNMKLMMNGAITLGTLDGANIEIADLAGRENEAIFGLTAPEVEQLWASNSYFAWDTLNNDRERLGRVMDELKDNTFAGLSGNFESIYNELMNNNDPDLVMADFRSYVDAWEKLTGSYGDQETWNRKALLNTASSGWFSSDRTIREYRDEIWHA